MVVGGKECIELKKPSAVRERDLFLLLFCVVSIVEEREQGIIVSVMSPQGQWKKEE